MKSATSWMRLLGILMMVGAIVSEVWANTTTVDGITWTYTVKNGEASLGGGHGRPAVPTSTTGSITIPSTLDGYRVTSIGYDAFRFCSGLASVTIPDSVTSIGNFAFEDCSGLTSVTIPSSVTNIGRNAFYWCSKLTAVHIHDLAAWCGIAFGDAAANPLSYAGHLYFNGEEVKDLVIPESVTNIAMYAFHWCSGLTSVTIPDSLTTIEMPAFEGCSGLTNISVTAGNTQYSSVNGLLLSKDGATLLQGINGDVTIPDSVVSIGNYSFSGCSNLTSVTIPSSVTNIGEEAFYCCRGLTSVTIPDKVTSIGGYAFQWCSGLTNITVSAGNTQYSSVNGLLLSKDGTTLFQGINGAVAIPDGVTSIGDFAFSDCSGLTSVTISESVTSIGYDAFYGCRGLASVTIPDSVTNIGAGAFYGCRGLTSVTIGNGVTSIGSLAFSGCSGMAVLYVPASWEGEAGWLDMLARAKLPEGCRIVYLNDNPEEATSTTPMPVTFAWLEEKAGAILEANGGDYEAAAGATAANGRPVWACYVADLDPTDAGAELRMEWVDGAPVYGPVSGRRVYVLEGSEDLGDPNGWSSPTNARQRYFRVRVEVP